MRLKKNLTTLVAGTLLAISAHAYADNSQYACKGKVSGDAYENYKIRNNRTGGFVADTANVEENVSLGKATQICDYADVEGGKVLGAAIIGGNAVMNSGKVMGQSYVGGNATINGGIITDHAKVLGGTVDKGVILRGWYVLESGSLAPGVYSAPDPQISIDQENARQAEERQQEARDDRQRRINTILSLQNDISRLAGDNWGRGNYVTFNGPCNLKTTDIDDIGSDPSGTKNTSEVNLKGNSLRSIDTNEYSIVMEFNNNPVLYKWYEKDGSLEEDQTNYGQELIINLNDNYKTLSNFNNVFYPKVKKLIDMCSDL